MQYRDSPDCPAILQESRFASVVRGVIPTLSRTISITTQIIPTSTPTLLSSLSLPAETTSVPIQPGPGLNHHLSFGESVWIIIPGGAVAVAIMFLLLLRCDRIG